jgi:hypothetical protein
MNIEPGIYRPEFPMDSNFTMVPNALIRDNNLPSGAKMLLIYLLSHKIGYQILDSQIVNEIGMGREALRTARKHLTDEGFISLERVRNFDNSLGAYRYELQDPRGWFSTVGNPTVGEPTVGEATVGNPPDNRKLIPKKTMLKKTNLENTGDNGFDVFWSVYPKKDDKPLAKRSFEKALDRATLDIIIAGAERYRDDPNREPGFTKNPSTWLNADAWENAPLPSTRKKTNSERNVENFRAKVALLNEQPMKEVENEQVGNRGAIDFGVNFRSTDSV